EAGVQVVEEEAVLLSIPDGRVRRERERLAGRVQDVVVAERPGEAGVHEIADPGRAGVLLGGRDHRGDGGRRRGGGGGRLRGRGSGRLRGRGGGRRDGRGVGRGGAGK